MLPSFTDYMHGLRRLWWIPVLAAIVGLGLGIASVGGAPPNETRGNTLFTFRIDDPGDDSAGSARGAEMDVSQARLAGYAHLARNSPQVREILAARGIEEPPTVFSETGDFKDGRAPALIDISGPGIVEVRVKNTEISPEDAEQLVTALTEEVARQAAAIDAQNITPSLRPDPLVTSPVVAEVPQSPSRALATPALLLAILGLGVVYLVVWRQDRICARRDIEGRLDVRVLGDLAGRPGDAHAIVLALTKGRESGTRVLILPLGDARDAASEGVGTVLADAGQALGLNVTLAPADQSVAAPVPVGPADLQTDAGGLTTTELALVEATGGLDANALRTAVGVDIIAAVVSYGRTTYENVHTADRTLAEVTDADFAVIGC